MFSLSLVTPSVGLPVTLDEAKRHLHVAIEISDHNSYIEALIGAARDYAELYTNRQLMTATWDLTLDRFPRYGEPIYLPKAPLQSVTSITYMEEAAGVSTVWSASEYRVQKTEPGRISRGLNYDYPDLYGVNGQVTIRFVAGYGSASDVPQGIKQAMLLLIGHWFNNREEVGRVGGRIEVAAHALMGLHRFGDEFVNYGSGA